MSLFRPSFHWFSTRFVFDRPAGGSPVEIPGEAPAEGTDTRAGERRAVDADLERLAGRTTSSGSPAAPVERIEVPVGHVDISKEKKVDDWMKIDSAAKPLETKLNRFHETDRDDYVFFRMLSMLPGFREEDVTSDGKPNMGQMRLKMADSNENGDVGRTFGFYWSGNDWAVIENGWEDDENHTESGGFVNTFKTLLLPDLRSEAKDNDNPLSIGEVNDLANSVDSFGREYDLLKSDSEPVLTDSDKKLDIYKDDTKKVVDELRNAKDWTALSAPALALLSKHFISDAGSYKFRLVSRGGKAFIYALRYTDQQELSRLRILELGTETKELDEKGNPKIALSDRAFLNAASWNREVYRTDADARPKLLELIDDLPKAEVDQERIRQLAGGPINAEVARQICEKVLANEKNLRYSFPSPDALQQRLTELLISKFNKPPYDVMNTAQRENVAKERAKTLVNLVLQKIDEYDGGVFRNLDPEERAKLEIDFEFDAVEGIRIEPKGPAVDGIMRKAKEARQKASEAAKDTADDLKEKLPVKNPLTAFLLEQMYEDGGGKEELLKDAKSPIWIVVFKALDRLVTRFEPFFEKMKDKISAGSEGLVTFEKPIGILDFKQLEKEEIELAEIYSELKEDVFLSRIFLAKKFKVSKTIRLKVEGKTELQEFEAGREYTNVRFSAGVKLPKGAFIGGKDSKFEKPVPSGSSTSSSPGMSGASGGSSPAAPSSSRTPSTAP